MNLPLHPSELALFALLALAVLVVLAVRITLPERC
jgi:hypothetical protein